MYFSTTNNIHEVITKQETLKIEGKVKVGSFNFDIVGSTSSENAGNLFFNINNFSDNGSGYNSRSRSGRATLRTRAGLGAGKAGAGAPKLKEVETLFRMKGVS